jgi:hypothetical protein
MKRNILITLVFTMALIMNCEAQLIKDLKKMVQPSSSGKLTEEEAASGIREALIKGTTTGVETVSKLDGYFKNPEIKIPFPPEAKEIEQKLRAIGLGNKVDEAVLSINRAAEDAAVEAKPIFISAIKNLTLRDVFNIVKGEKDEATRYLKNNTTQQLTVQFRPKIETSLEKVDATKYWDDVITSYNKIPFVKKMNPDLAEYVTEKAIEGLFVMIAREEENIRKNPAARTTELLRKVFGN